jgi:hypothetical protein
VLTWLRAGLHSNIIWFGDFNYRLSGTRHKVYQLLKEFDLTTLHSLDQLNRERKAGRTFVGFQEYPLTFMPTYKLDTGTLRYDTRCVLSASSRIVSKLSMLCVFPLMLI